MPDSSRQSWSSGAAEEQRFSDTLRRIEARAREGSVTLGELLLLCGPRGHGFLAVFLILPFLQPIPLPGLSSAIGVLLAIIGVFVALRRPPWVPVRISSMVMESDAVLRICQKLEKLLGALEHVVKPRVRWLFPQRWFRVTNGLVWMIHAVVFSLPLPIPFTNTFPAVVILLMALGILEEDFLLILLGYVAVVANLLFFGSLLALPTMGWQMYGT